MSAEFITDGGVTSPDGFRASGVNAGIKAEGLDLAVLISDEPATVAGVFTTNAFQAAPVQYCRKVVADGKARAVVVNSGCANACTGDEGIRANAAVVEGMAEVSGVAASEVLVCSTGTIGKPLPVSKIVAGLPEAVASAAASGGGAAARAIMTTDTVPKSAAVCVSLGGKRVTIGGMAKGAGMINPRLATMLAFMTTDATVATSDLKLALDQAVARSFNRITIDGDTSTNDTVLLLANGAAGGESLSPASADWPAFCEALESLACHLAQLIVKDGEGATRFVTVSVNGAQSGADAHRAAQCIANSPLCKTAWFGGDPNWGRIICALGYSGIPLDPDRVEIAFDDVCVVRQGGRNPDVDATALQAVLDQKVFEVRVDLHLGEGCDAVYTCDFSYDYVKINADYMT